MKYSYNICATSDETIFKMQCEALEKCIFKIEKGEPLEDVDGSKTQIYHISGKEVRVKNSFYIGAVFIESDVELTQYFN